MFYNCSKLKTIDLSKFETSFVTSLNSIFYNCENLELLNLQNFNTNLITNMNQMFYGCKNLKTLDLSNFDTSNVLSMNEMFSDDINLYHINFANINTSSLLSMSKMFKNCKKLEFINFYSLEIYKNIIIDEMLYGIPEDIKYCIKGELKAVLIENEFNKKENSTNDCINICPKREKFLIPEKKKCIDNCMKDDIYKFFYDNICIIDCPEYYPYEMVFTHQCLSNCLYEDFFNKQCKLKYKTISNIENLINKIDKDITLRLLDSLINSSLKENKEDLIVKEDILTYQITTSENQNEKYYSDISNIYLGDCETKLKQYYNISQNVSLLILKIDYNIPDLLIPMVEYKIYHPETKIPLELDICKDTTIGLSFPISIDDNNLNKHDQQVICIQINVILFQQKIKQILF